MQKQMESRGGGNNCVRGVDMLEADKASGSREGGAKDRGDPARIQRREGEGLKSPSANSSWAGSLARTTSASNSSPCTRWTASRGAVVGRKNILEPQAAPAATAGAAGGLEARAVRVTAAGERLRAAESVQLYVSRCLPLAADEHDGADRERGGLDLLDPQTVNLGVV